MGYENYNGFNQKKINNKVDFHVEQILICGYSVLENVVDSRTIQVIKDKLDKALKNQIKEYGEKKLKNIKDFGTARCLPNEDSYFVGQIALNKNVYEVISAILGDTCILHLQNGITIYPNNTKHNEGNWHMDFQKNFVSSKPLSLNALWVIDDFNSKTGGTWIVPNTHNLENIPSKEFIETNKIQIEAKSGSVVIFDSRMLHKGGDNHTTDFRRSINNQYTRPFIKQQINLPEFLKNKYDKNSKEGQILGYYSIPPKSVQDFRVSNPSDRTYRAGQG